MAEATADKSKDKNERSDNEDMAEWERRLAEGDLPEDFLAVTEPQSKPQNTQDAATGLLVDIPTVKASNSKDPETPHEPTTASKSKLSTQIHTCMCSNA